MAITTSTRWSSRGFGYTSDNGWEAQLFVDVVGEAGEPVTADYAVQLLRNTYYNTNHPNDPRITCNSVQPHEIKGTSFVCVKLGYAMPRWGSWLAANPLDWKPKLKWGKCIEYVDAEHQITSTGAIGGAILNSAWFPYNPKPTRPQLSRIMTIKRWEPFYNVAQAQSFEERVNKTAVSLGPLSIGVGQCLCTGIEPIGEYRIDAPAVEVQYDFLINLNRQHPFQLWLLDKGSTAWYSDSGTLRQGRIVAGTNGSSAYTEIAGDVPFDGNGKPAIMTGAASLMVLGIDGKCHTPATVTRPSAPLSTVTVDGCTVNIWRIRADADFTALTIADAYGSGGAL